MMEIEATMLKAPRLAARLRAICIARGIAPRATDVIVADDADGKSPRLVHWESARLGPVPTQAEVDAAAWEPVANNIAIDAQIRALEASGYPRALREFMLEAAAALKAAQVVDLTQSRGLQDVAELDTRIRDLRAQRRATA